VLANRVFDQVTSIVAMNAKNVFEASSDLLVGQSGVTKFSIIQFGRKIV
jgi:hypothetical protein